MQVRIVILPDGRIGLYTEQGTFEEGARQLRALLASLGAEGIEFAEIGEVERHRHDDEHAHQHHHEGVSHGH